MLCPVEGSNHYLMVEVERVDDCVLIADVLVEEEFASVQLCGIGHSPNTYCVRPTKPTYTLIWSICKDTYLL